MLYGATYEIMASMINQRYIVLSGNHFSDADYADDVAAMECNPPDITETLEKIVAANSVPYLHKLWA